jgi:predicted DCC family thiol-disulfide oxidoreductase YuxK
MTCHLDGPVLIYDGDCNLCASIVGFVLPRDRRGRVRLAARQSEAGRQLLQEAGCPGESAATVVLVESGGCHVRSEAGLRLVRYLPFPWPLLTVLRGVPRVLRDLIYDWVARNREHWFGRRAVCLVSAVGYEDRFLV